MCAMPRTPGRAIPWRLHGSVLVIQSLSQYRLLFLTYLAATIAARQTTNGEQ